MKWKLGDKFVINNDTLHLLERGLKETFALNNIMMYVDSFLIDEKETLHYVMLSRLLDGNTLRWFLTNEEIKIHLHYIDTNIERFVGLDE